jgi:hypothetical protein
MPLSDPSGTCTRVIRPWPSPAGLLALSSVGIPEVSRFSCLKFLGVQGSSTTQGQPGISRYRFPSMLPSAI